jgi:hypothetical protein
MGGLLSIETNTELQLLTFGSGGPSGGLGRITWSSARGKGPVEFGELVPQLI